MNKQQKASDDNTRSSSITVAFAAASMMMMLLLAAANISTVESKDDLTLIRFYDCNEETLGQDSSYIDLARDLLQDAVNEAPLKPNYVYSTWLSAHGDTAYVYGDCDQDRTSDDCRDCLTANRQALFDICLNATGAQIVMNGCYMRYENYRF